jgi:hypothetical protein
MDDKTTYYVGTDSECLKLIDWLIEMDIEYDHYGMDDYTSAVKFWSPFITPNYFEQVKEDY